jgi:hypothetical protein
MTTDKGFKPTPHLTQGEKIRLERLCDRILSGEAELQVFFDWVTKTTQKLGGRKFWTDWFIRHSNEDLGAALSSKFHEVLWAAFPDDVRKEMGSIAQGGLAKILVSEGFVLGKDFSIGSDGALILGREALDKLKSDLPPELWEKFEADEMVKPFQSCPWTAVEDRLGVSFRQNLKARLSDLIEQGHPTEVVAGWLFCTSCGISSQVAGSDEDYYLLSELLIHTKENHPTDYDQLVNALSDSGFLDSDVLLDMGINILFDVLIAAGGSEENGEIKGDGISRDGLQRLSLVWRGSSFSVPELICELDKFTDGKKAA